MDMHREFRSRQRGREWFRPLLAPVDELESGGAVDGNNNLVGSPHTTNERRRYVPGRPEDVILRTNDADFLDLDALRMMGPHELENFISDLWHLSQGQRLLIMNI